MIVMSVPKKLVHELAKPEIYTRRQFKFISGSGGMVVVLLVILKVPSSLIV